jgi:hypothetical protein
VLDARVVLRKWPDQRGLIQRRHDEARLWRAGFAALPLE